MSYAVFSFQWAAIAPTTVLESAAEWKDGKKMRRKRNEDNEGSIRKDKRTKSNVCYSLLRERSLWRLDSMGIFCDRSSSTLVVAAADGSETERLKNLKRLSVDIEVGANA